MKNFSDIQENFFIDTPAAINRKTGVLYINPNYWNRLSDASKNFVIAHEYGHLINNTSNEKIADDYAFWRQVGLGENSIGVLKSFYEALPFTTDEQIERGEKLLRTVFRNEFKNGNPAAQTFLDIIEFVPEPIDGARGFLAKIAGGITSFVGSVLTLIPVTSAIGVAVSAGGAAITTGAKLAEATALGKEAYAEAENEVSAMLSQEIENLKGTNEIQTAQANAQAIKTVKSASSYLEEREKGKKKRNIIVICICAITVVVCLIILNR